MKADSVPRVFVSPTSFGDTNPEPILRLQHAGYTVTRNKTGRRLTSDEVIEATAGCVGLIAGVETLDAATLRQLESLRCISRCGVGADNIDLAVARELGVDVRTTPDAPTVAVAEFTVGLMLALMRRIPQASQDFHAGAWRKHTGVLLQERVVGLIGLGRIGRAVACRLRAFGCRMLGCDPQVDARTSADIGVQLEPIDAVLAYADVMSVHVAMPAGAPPVLGRQEIAALREGAYIVNVSRGAAIDECALVEALRTGRIAGAALDVFTQEPYDGPLRGMPNVIATPHIASYAAEARLRMELEAAGNLIAALRDVPSARLA